MVKSCSSTRNALVKELANNDYLYCQRYRRKFRSNFLEWRNYCYVKSRGRPRFKLFLLASSVEQAQYFYFRFKCDETWCFIVILSYFTFAHPCWSNRPGCRLVDDVFPLFRTSSKPMLLAAAAAVTSSDAETEATCGG